MSEPNHTETQAPEQPCEDCGSTSGEKILGWVTLGICLLIGLMALDILTSGKLSGMVRQRAET